MKQLQTAKLLLAALALGGSLSGCFPVIVGAGAVGVMAAVDRRTSGAQLDDEGIELRGASRINETLGDKAHVNITSYNRQVLLTGEVANEQDKQAAEQIVGKVENVRAVVNELAVLGLSTLSQRSSDAVVTTRVKGAMVNEKNLYANAFKVTTERGVVYLMGRVTQRESDLATEVTRNTTGVLKVVRVMEIISEEELRRLQPQPAPVTDATPKKTG
jgi:osmotically-inducible protein OsmY